MLSTLSTVGQDLGEDKGRQGGGSDSHSSHVAEEVLVHPFASDGMPDSMHVS